MILNNTSDFAVRILGVRIVKLPLCTGALSQVVNPGVHNSVSYSQNSCLPDTRLMGQA